jgi:hypothetical protein
MSNRQYQNSENPKPPCSVSSRLVALLVFLGLAGGGTVLWLSAQGTVDFGFWMGVCGFKQRYGLPCPGCGWTHATQMFLTGHPIRAFVIQPAAAFFCVAAAAAGIYALLIAVFGVEFAPLRHLFRAVGIKVVVLSAVIVILAGWGVTLSREILHR